MAIDFRANQIRTNKIISSGSTGTGAKIVMYDVAAASNSEGAINTTVFSTASIGTDVYLYISGAINSKNTGSTNGTIVLGGDLVVSGNIYTSGSVKSRTRLFAASYNFSSASSANPKVIGQIYFEPSEHYSNNIKLRVILSVSTGSNICYVRLYNITSGSNINIGGSGITELSSSNQTPELKESINLKTAVNWTTGSTPSILEIQLYSSSSTAQAIVGSAEIITT